MSERVLKYRKVINGRKFFVGKGLIIFFFFFSNEEELHDFNTIKEAFVLVFGARLYTDFYCSMEKYFKAKIQRLAYRNILREKLSPIAELYDNPYPDIEDAKRFYADFESKVFSSSERKRVSLEMEEAEAIVYWVYHVYKTPKRRRIVTIEALEAFCIIFGLQNLEFAGDVLYVPDRVEIKLINSFDRFCKEIEQMNDKNYTYFFRGHSSASYRLIPSVMRRKQWIIHENDMYNELRIECSGDFSNCKTHLDYLVEMQHYGMPTRLLDVTKNPLVALYFACRSQEDEKGEIIVLQASNQTVKYPGSDVVTILSSLPLMSYEKKQSLLEMFLDDNITDVLFNKHSVALLHEIKLEKPAFRNEIKKEDIGRAVFVLSEKKNKRIVKQDGAFIICGLFAEKENPINDFRYTENKLLQVFIVTPEGKKQIMEQLDRFSINKATLFPEIEDVAEYIKNRY